MYIHCSRNTSRPLGRTELSAISFGGVRHLVEMPIWLMFTFTLVSELFIAVIPNVLDMPPKSSPITSVASGITLALLVMSLVVAIVIEPDVVAIEEKFKLIFASLFLGVSIGHFMGEALIDEGENKKYALLGLFTTLGIGFLGYLFWGQGTSLFSGSIAGVLAFPILCLILSHHNGLIAESERLDTLVEALAEKVSPGGLLIIIAAFVSEFVLGPEAALFITMIATTMIGVLFAFYILKYRDIILEMLDPWLEELDLKRQKKS